VQAPLHSTKGGKVHVLFSGSKRWNVRTTEITKTKPTLPGGFQLNDIIYSTRAFTYKEDPTKNVVKGEEGVVTGLATQEVDKRLEATFSGSKAWDVLPTDISKWRPTDSHTVTIPASDIAQLAADLLEAAPHYRSRLIFSLVVFSYWLFC